MANPFLNIIPALKPIYQNAIDAILDSTGLTVPCRFYYGSKPAACPNCLIDPIGKKSANKYNGTGPTPFPDSTICPVCAGLGLLAGMSTDSFPLAIIWNYKDWIDVGVHVDDPGGYVQSISSISILPNIRQATEMIMDTNIEQYQRNRFQLFGEPNPAGFGQDTYVICMWKRI